MTITTDTAGPPGMTASRLRDMRPGRRPDAGRPNPDRQTAPGPCSGRPASLNHEAAE